MYRNMVTSLLEHERITTTLAKAKELRGHTERTISVGVRLGDLLSKDKADRNRDEQARFRHAMQLAGQTIRTKEVLDKLFDDIALRFQDRPGGYTRITRVGKRVGDAAEMVVIELVDRNEDSSDDSDD
jgi:large subunit ribosomal protein L17